jgi:MOSC domain-containing protein YiiM
MSGLDVNSVASALATIAGVGEDAVPRPGAADPWPAWREWLATRNLGLVPVRDPGGFVWPGRFLAILDDGSSSRGVVMFGVPPGVLDDPSDGDGGTVTDAYVLASLDPSLAPGSAPYGRGQPGQGVVEAIAVAAAAESEPVLVESARAISGRGLEGDRYAAGEGTFSGGTGDGRALTLIEAEVLEAMQLPDGSRLGAAEARRNLVTRGISLNPLVGRRFTVGDVECEGRRLCEPCAHLQRLTSPGVLRGLVHRGGLRADILSDGVIEVGATVRALS